jgi:glutamate dehydrogenase/leucine dehydrogenase
MNDDALMLTFGGAKGGISGSKKGKHQEWLSRF